LKILALLVVYVLLCVLRQAARISMATFLALKARAKQVVTRH